MLALFGACLPPKRLPAWQKQVRRITRALGDARDTDVQIDFITTTLAQSTEKRVATGIKRLLLRLQQRRQRQQIKVLQTLEALEESRLIPAIEQELRQVRIQALMQPHTEPSPQLYWQAEERLTILLANLLSYEIYIDDPQRAEELHALRIAAKRLRYTLQVYASLYDGALDPAISAAKSIQNLLGEMHDCDVWLAALPDFLLQERERTLAFYGHARGLARLKPGIDYLLEERQQTRTRVYRQFRRHWAELQAQQTWPALLHILADHRPPHMTAPPEVAVDGENEIL
jgi:CHAD domain-containing protein